MTGYFCFEMNQKKKKRRKNTNKVMSQKPFFGQLCTERVKEKAIWFWTAYTDKVLQKWLLGKA